MLRLRTLLISLSQTVAKFIKLFTPICIFIYIKVIFGFHGNLRNSMDTSKEKTMMMMMDRDDEDVNVTATVATKEGEKGSEVELEVCINPTPERATAPTPTPSVVLSGIIISEEMKRAHKPQGPHHPITSVTPVIGFIDVDAFECQLWQRDLPEKRGQPCVVVTQSGRVLSASYEAKDLGINRSDTPYLRQALELAKKKGKHLTFFRKPDKWGKQDQSNVRRATWQIVTCVQKFLKMEFPGVEVNLEVASSDEMYLDLSVIVTRIIDGYCSSKNKKVILGRPAISIPKYVVWERRTETKKGPFEYRLARVPTIKNGMCEDLRSYGYKNEERLMFGALFMQDLLSFLAANTGFIASGGIAKNKLLAKVGCGLNKPQKITVLYEEAFRRVSKKVLIPSIPGFGGNLGQEIQDEFHVQTVSEIQRKVPFSKLEEKFGTEKAQQIFSKSMGQDNSSVRNKISREQIKCNKPRGDITNVRRLVIVLDWLTAEIRSIVKEEAERYSRTTYQVRVEFKFRLKNKMKPKKNDVDDDKDSEESKLDEGELVSDVFDLEGKDPDQKLPLPIRILKFMKDVPNFDNKSFVITELAFVLRNFTTLEGKISGKKAKEKLEDEVDSSPKALDDVEIINQNQTPPESLRINGRLCNPVAPELEVSTVGAFKITGNMKSSIKNCHIPRLLSEEKLHTTVVGQSLLEGFHPKKSEAFLITDYTMYDEFKHQCFSKWLTKEKKKVEGLDDIGFIAFSGRMMRALKTVLNKTFGEWDMYAMNVDGVIHIWDEKTPRSKSHRFQADSSYCGDMFEKLVTGMTMPDRDGCPSEMEKVFPIQKITFGKHKLLLLDNVDAMDDEGNMVQVTAGMDPVHFTRKNESLLVERHSKLWAQSVLSGAKRMVLGTKDNWNIVTKIQVLGIEEAPKQFEFENSDMCFHFLHRLLDWIKLHLPEPNRKLVKKFAWIPGKDCLCSTVPEEEVEKLILPRIYLKR